MKAFLFAVLALAPFVVSYDEVYDKIDVDKILADESLFNTYLDCLLDKGPCSIEHAEEFRKLLPEVIATACAKCTKIQRDHVRKSVKALQERRPEQFKQFCEKYDPKDEYKEAFAAFLVATN